MDSPDPEQLVKVLRGNPDAGELAALVAVVVARAASRENGHRSERAPAAVGWHRPERTYGFLGPRTWRGVPRVPRPM